MDAAGEARRVENPNWRVLHGVSTTKWSITKSHSSPSRTTSPPFSISPTIHRSPVSRRLSLPPCRSASTLSAVSTSQPTGSLSCSALQIRPSRCSSCSPLPLPRSFQNPAQASPSDRNTFSTFFPGPQFAGAMRHRVSLLRC